MVSETVVSTEVVKYEAGEEGQKEHGIFRVEALTFSEIQLDR